MNETRKRRRILRRIGAVLAGVVEHLDKGQRELPEPEEGAITRY